jgi:23S rRNA (uracil1939-C5)-methyltransferase
MKVFLLSDVFILDTPYGLDIHIKPQKNESLSLLKRETLAKMGNNKQVVRLIYNQEPIISKVHLPIWPDAFLQPSQEGEDILVHLMLSYIKNEKKAVDLFCGSGTFTNPLLKKGIKVTGYDCAVDSVSLLGQNGIVRDLFRSPLLAEELNGLDLIELDPPRSGARLQTEQIAQTSVPKIIMISCNPQTAARDIKILTNNGWNLKHITAVDQFKWSNHVELVCLLEK